jgi:hypothetical protein
MNPSSVAASSCTFSSRERRQAAMRDQSTQQEPESERCGAQDPTPSASKDLGARTTVFQPILETWSSSDLIEANSAPDDMRS